MMTIKYKRNILHFITAAIPFITSYAATVRAMSAPSISDVPAAALSGQLSSSTSSSPSSSSTATFRLGIRDSFMIGHSFHNHPAFGPAGGLHGATYTCDVEFIASSLQQELNWVIDIGEATSILHEVLSRYNYKNLDEIFGPNIMTTTEFMCRQIHSDLCQKLIERKIVLPSLILSELPLICVKLYESHKAWASYTALLVANNE